MQGVIESLHTTKAKLEEPQSRLENTLITKSDGDATII